MLTSAPDRVVAFLVSFKAQAASDPTYLRQFRPEIDKIDSEVGAWSVGMLMMDESSRHDDSVVATVVVVTTKGLLLLDPMSASLQMAVAWRRMCRFDVKELNDDTQAVGFSYLTPEVGSVDERLARRAPMKASEFETKYLYMLTKMAFFDAAWERLDEVGIPSDVHGVPSLF